MIARQNAFNIISSTYKNCIHFDVSTKFIFIIDDTYRMLLAMLKLKKYKNKKISSPFSS